MVVTKQFQSQICKMLINLTAAKVKYPPTNTFLDFMILTLIK